MKTKLKYFFIFILPVILLGCVNHLQLGANAYNEGKYDVAAGYWNPLAINGDPYAQYNIGLLWEDGLGSTKKNINEASQWYLKSAQQSYVPSMVRLALIQNIRLCSQIMLLGKVDLMLGSATEQD
jgi:TPR repeat protein